MRVLMVGVDSARKGGMWSVAENYLNDPAFCGKTNLSYIPTATFGSVPHRLLFSAKAFYSIHRLLSKQKVDIIHVHMAEKGSTFRAGIVEKIAGRFGCKVMLQIHAEYKGWYSGQREIIRSAISQILRKADCLLIFGEYWKDFFSRITGPATKIRILSNGVPAPAANSYRKDAPYLLYFAVIDRQKGIFDLLEALRRVDGNLPPRVKLALCGVDRDGEVRRTVENLGLSHRVEMLGWIDGWRKEEIMAKTCLHILPSYSEAFPMSILETMAHGIPNISTSVAAIPEMIEDGENGILVQPGSPEELAQAIERLVLNERERLKFSGNAYRTVKKKFDLQKQKERLLEIYKQILVN